MTKETKSWILDAVRDITVAKMSNTTLSLNKSGGQNVGDFMEEVYNKLVTLTEKNNVL